MKILYIPADKSKPLEVRDVASMEYPVLNLLLQFAYPKSSDMVERVVTPALHALAQPDYDPKTRTGGERWPSVNMVVDEEGAIRNLPHNKRASRFYPGKIFGDALLVGEDVEWVQDDGVRYEEQTWVGLPEVAFAAVRKMFDQ